MTLIQTLRFTQPKTHGIAKTEVTGVGSGFPELDQLTGGFKPGQLIFVAGRPGMGKTALILNIVERVAIREDLPVVLFCSAERTSDLEMRLASSICSICLRDIGPAQESGMAWLYLSKAKKTVQRSKLYIDGNWNVSVEELSERVRWLTHEHGKLGLIVVNDFEQTHVSSRRGKARANELDALSYALKLLAQEHCCPVIVPTQLGRKMEVRHDKRPRLTDLRDDGRLEEAADMIITVYRDDYYKHDASHIPCVAEINVVKHHNGNTGCVMLAFNKSLRKFENLTNPHQDSI